MSELPSEQPTGDEDFTLFPDADHLPLEYLGDAASRSTMSLSPPAARAGCSPDALAAVFSATGLEDADKSQLLAQIAELQLRLQALRRLKEEVDRALAAKEYQCERLVDENHKLATSLAHAQQRYNDNKPRRFEYTDAGK